MSKPYIVYSTKSGGKFHKRHCSAIHGRHFYNEPIELALAHGLQPCEKCFPSSSYIDRAVRQADGNVLKAKLRQEEKIIWLNKNSDGLAHAYYIYSHMNAESKDQVHDEVVRILNESFIHTGSESSYNCLINYFAIKGYKDVITRDEYDSIINKKRELAKVEKCEKEKQELIKQKKDTIDGIKSLAILAVVVACFYALIIFVIVPRAEDGTFLRMLGLNHGMDESSFTMRPLAYDEKAYSVTVKYNINSNGGLGKDWGYDNLVINTHKFTRDGTIILKVGSVVDCSAEIFEADAVYSDESTFKSKYTVSQSDLNNSNGFTLEVPHVIVRERGGYNAGAKADVDCSFVFTPIK